MSTRPTSLSAELESLWAHHYAQFRDTRQIVAQWAPASAVDPDLLRWRTRGDWWDALEQTGQTLLVTREYEHLVIALTVHDGRPRVSYLALPHPSGLAVEPSRGRVHLASTRNPNVVFELAPCDGMVRGASGTQLDRGLLIPRAARYLPGCLYLHDLAFIGPSLHANAVGLNAIVRLDDGEPGFSLVWWPRSIDDARGGHPLTDRNYIQLNSIAAGPSLSSSYFTATAAAPSHRRPGHVHFPVDRRGVLFCGATREVVAGGLTRPHSARLLDGVVWLDNSGYGEVGRVEAGRFEPVAALRGWTRGLHFTAGLAFVGTSRVIPKYRRYAPGLDPDRCETGVHALDLSTGRVVGSLLWPRGNQIFAIDSVDRSLSHGFPFVRPGDGRRARQLALFSRGLAASNGRQSTHAGPHGLNGTAQSPSPSPKPSGRR